jgi:hypothetical protein
MTFSRVLAEVNGFSNSPEKYCKKRLRSIFSIILYVKEGPVKKPFISGKYIPAKLPWKRGVNG